jgi:hypothetical protein
MERRQRHRGKLSGIGGAMITIAGLAIFQASRDRLGAVAWAVRDNPVSAGVVVFGLVIIVIW